MATAMDGTVSMHEVNHKSGALTFLGAIKTQSGTSSILVSTSGQFAYVTNERSNTILPYKISTKTGILTPTSAGPASTGFGPFSLVHPSGRFVHALSRGSGSLSVFETSPAVGIQMEVSGSPFSSKAMSGIYMAAFDPTGRFAYASLADDRVAAFTVDETSGAWTFVEGYTHRAADRPGMVAVHPSGHYAYIATNTGVLVFAIERASGAWNPLDDLSLKTIGAAFHLVIEPTGKFILVGTGDGTVHVYQIDFVSGELKPLTATATGILPISSMAIDSSGRFVYVTHFASYQILGFQLSPSGTLTPISGSPFSTSPDAPSFTKVTSIDFSEKHKTAITLTPYYH